MNNHKEINKLVILLNMPTLDKEDLATIGLMGNCLHLLAKDESGDDAGGDWDITWQGEFGTLCLTGEELVELMRECQGRGIAWVKSDWRTLWDKEFNASSATKSKEA